MLSKLGRFIKSQYVIFSLIITIKALVVHIVLFHNFDIVKVFIYEGSYIFILLAIVEFLPAKFKGIIYLITDGIITTLFAGIIVYSTYFNTIPTYFALFELGQVSSISDSVISLLNPLYFLLYLDIVILIFFHFSKRFHFPKARINRKWLSVTFSLSFILAILLFFYYKGITIDNPVLAAENKGILNYEMLNIYTGPGNDIKPLNTDLTISNINNQIAEIKGKHTETLTNHADYGIAQNRNVIVVQLESLQNFLIGLKVDGQEVTPNLNRLLQNSMYFPNVFQQIGPGNTSDAEFMMNTSLFPSAYSATSLLYGKKSFPSLPKLLDKYGYNTMTLHVDNIKFWNRDELYPGLGFDHVYDGVEYYGNQDIVGMGPSDDVLYTKAAHILKQSNQPFYAQIISLSAHHPYKMPNDKIGLELPSDYHHSLLGDYLQSQHYADAALGRFIIKLKEEGLWDNSILLFYGDHFGLAKSELNNHDLDLMHNLIHHSYSNIDRFNIPYIITIPGKTHGQVIEKVGGQLDFLPTLTNLLGINIHNDIVQFGDDLLNKQEPLIGLRYYMPTGSYITSSTVFVPNKGFSDGKIYSLSTHQQLPLLNKYKLNYEKIMTLEHLSDAYLESLPNQTDSQ